MLNKGSREGRVVRVDLNDKLNELSNKSSQLTSVVPLTTWRSIIRLLGSTLRGGPRPTTLTFIFPPVMCTAPTPSYLCPSLIETTVVWVGGVLCH